MRNLLNGLECWYDLGRPQFGAIRNSAKPRHSIDTNAPTAAQYALVASPYGQALRCDKNWTDNACQAGGSGSLITGKGAWTLDAVFSKVITSTDYQGLIGFRNSSGTDEAHMAVLGGSNIEAKYTVGSAVQLNYSGAINPVGTWNHLALVFTGSRIKVAINGKVIANSASTARWASTSILLQVMKLVYVGANTCAFRHAAVWSRALSEHELMWLAANKQADYKSLRKGSRFKSAQSFKAWLNYHRQIRS